MKERKRKELYELTFCLELMEKQGHCAFGGKSSCDQCGAMYLLRKMILSDHGPEKRWTKEEWKQEIKKLDSSL